VKKEIRVHTLILQAPPIPSILIAVLEAAAADAVAVPEGAIDIAGSIFSIDERLKNELECCSDKSVCVQQIFAGVY
jgi:hypothetical protein